MGGPEARQVRHSCAVPHDDAREGVNLGCAVADVRDPVQDATIPLWLLYPTRAPTRAERFGPYALDAALDGAPAGEALPLVVISHGTGGSPWVYRDLAAYLVRAGFVVALPAHPGNHRGDNSLEETAANLENRPRHVRYVIDAAYAHPAVGPRVSRAGVSVIGHSLGGYTALAVAGGRPSALPHQTADGKARPLAVTHDPRVTALVLLAPATVWFAAEGALLDVDLPILMRTGALDTVTPSVHAEIVQRGIGDPKQLAHRVVPGAGHFAFLSPFPDAMTRPDFPPSQDPEGFDRRAYLPVLGADVLAFLQGSRGARTVEV